jgi:hypothetical protein
VTQPRPDQMHRHQTHPSRARRLHAHPQQPPRGSARTNYPMIFHEPALADLDAIALDHEARTLFLSATAKRLFEGGPRRALRLAERQPCGPLVPQRTTSGNAGRDCRILASAPADRRAPVALGPAALAVASKGASHAARPLKALIQEPASRESRSADRTDAPRRPQEESHRNSLRASPQAHQPPARRHARLRGRREPHRTAGHPAG